MEKGCRVIEDLLPLYVDGICSEESKKMIEEHIRSCSNCQNLLKDMQNETIENVIESDMELPESENILKEVSLSISKKAVYTATGILAVVLYWLIYVWQERLSMLGDYRYFSYGFHEVYGIGILIFPTFTIGWLIIHAWKMKKNKTWKKGLLLFMVLLVLSIGQLGFLHRQSQRVTVTCLATVKEVVDEYHVVIQSGENEVLLMTDPMVVSLLKTDGTTYWLGYETYQDNLDEGNLFAVWASDVE